MGSPRCTDFRHGRIQGLQRLSRYCFFLQLPAMLSFVLHSSLGRPTPCGGKGTTRSSRCVLHQLDNLRRWRAVLCCWCQYALGLTFFCQIWLQAHLLLLELGERGQWSLLNQVMRRKGEKVHMIWQKYSPSIPWDGGVGFFLVPGGKVSVAIETFLDQHTYPSQSLCALPQAQPLTLASTLNRE